MATAVTFGKRIESADINQVIYWMKGTAGYGDSMQLTDYGTLGSWALKIKHTNTTSGRALLIQNAEGTTDLLSVRRISGNDIVAIGVPDGTQSSGNLFQVNKSNAVAAYQMADFVYDHTGNTADVGAGRFVSRQTAGGTNVGNRALEMHMIKMTGTTASSAIGADISISSSIAGSGVYGTVGAWIRNFGTTFGIATPQTADTGLLIGAATEEFTNYIMVKTSPGLVTLFSVVTDGVMTSGRHDPRSNNAYDIGTTGNIWRFGYINTLAAGNGTVSLPSHSFNNDLDNGFYLSNTNEFSAATTGVQRMIWDANGSIVCGPSAVATNATDGFLYIRTCAGTPTGVPTGKTGCAAMVYDTTNDRLCIYDGSWLGEVLT